MITLYIKIRVHSTKLLHCLSPTRFCYTLSCKFPLSGWHNYNCHSAQASSILKQQLSGKHFTELKCEIDSVTLYKLQQLPEQMGDVIGNKAFIPLFCLRGTK